MTSNPGGVITPMNGDFVVYHHPSASTAASAGRYVVRQYPESAAGDEYESYDDAVAAATKRAAVEGVNVFLWEMPSRPVMLKHYRLE